MKKDIPYKWYQKKKRKKARMAILIPFKIDKTKSIARVKKGTFYDKSYRCNDYIHMYLKNPSKYRKQNLTDMKGDIENLTIIFNDFNTPLSVMGRQRVNMEMKDLNNSTVQSFVENITYNGE